VQDFRRFNVSDNERVRNFASPALRRLQESAAPTVNLEQARQHLSELERYREATKDQPKPKRERLLPFKPDLTSLYTLVQDLKQDIHLIKDAQSAEGAQKWIDRRGLEDHLVVDDRDIDGDNVPDIIVRRKADGSPYIVKGYTTKPSDYPIRQPFFERYPTAKDRKGHSLTDFTANKYIQGYTEGGFRRVLDPAALRQVNLSNVKGYSIKAPKTKLTVTQVFKTFLMKPAMAAIKEIVKQWNTSAVRPEDYIKFDLTAQTARDIESALKMSLITIPVMVRVYGEDVLEVTPEEFQKLSMRSEVKDGLKNHLAFYVENRMENFESFIDAIVELLLQTGVTNEAIVNALQAIYQRYVEKLYTMKGAPRDFPVDRPPGVNPVLTVE
jgi:hypothetical protein